MLELAAGQLAADLQACAALLRQGSRTFHAASRVLPARVRDPAMALYAFCRVADDAIDEGGREAALMQLRERLFLAYDGRPWTNPTDRAFAWAVTRYSVPRELPEALLEGFEWDLIGRRYETLEHLQAYAARVAGSVGAMMAVVMGARSAAVLARACDLGVAMQLTNIARDVGEDARQGRLYLPLEWLREVGIDPEAWLAAPVFDARLASVIDRLLRAADELYDRASAGIAALPLDCRPGMHAARLIYAEIGRELARRGLDAVSARTVVSGRRKLALLPWALTVAMLPAAAPADTVLEPVRFLVEAASRGQVERPRGLEGRVAWVLDLFERLERRDLAQAARA